MSTEPSIPACDLQSRYAAARAAWQRDVWAALAARLQQGIEIAERKKKEAKYGK